MDKDRAPTIELSADFKPSLSFILSFSNFLAAFITDLISWDLLFMVVSCAFCACSMYSMISCIIYIRGWGRNWEFGIENGRKEKKWDMGNKDISSNVRE